MVLVLATVIVPVEAKSSRASTSINPADLSDWVVYDHYYVPQGNTAAIFKANSGMPNKIGDFDADHPFFYHQEGAGSGGYKNDINDLSRTFDFNHHIWASGSGSGATVTMVGYSDKGYTDFILYPSGFNGTKTLSFDLDPAVIIQHAFTGIGILINAGISGGNMNGHLIYYNFKNSNVYLVKMTNQNANSLHGDGNVNLNGAKVLGTFTKTKMRIDMEVDPTSLTLKQTPYVGGDLGVPQTLTSSLTSTGNSGFGFLVDYETHACQQLSVVKVSNLILTEGYSVVFNPNVPDGDPNPVLTEANPNRIDGISPGATIGTDMPTNPTRQNHTFNYWSTNPTGGEGTEFGPNTPVNSTIILYAQWTREALPVTYRTDGNGMLQKTGSNPTPTVEYPNAEKGGVLNRQAPAPEPVPNRGYHFVNWTNKTGATINPSDSSLIVEANNQEITAHFAKNTYTVTYDAGEGSFAPGTPTTEDVIFGGNPNSTPTPLPPANKQFIGWKVGTSQEIVTDLSKVVIEDNVTITAAYDYVGYDVTFTTSDAEKGTVEGKLSYTDVKHGAALPAFPETKAKPGFAFDKWVDKNGSEIPSGATMEERYTTMSAVFGTDSNGDGVVDGKQKRVNVSFVVADNTGGTLTGTTQFVAYGDGRIDLTAPNVVVGGFTVPTPVPADGYRFTGWDSENYTVDTNTTTEVTYTATFKVSAGVSFTPSKGGTLTGETSYPDAVVGDEFPPRPAPKPDKGYVFDFWELGDGTQLPGGNRPWPQVSAENRTVVAQFAEDENGDGTPDYKQLYPVSFSVSDSRLGSLTGETSQEIAYGKFPDSVPTLTFDENIAVFNGWTAYDGVNTVKNVDPANYKITSQTHFSAELARIASGVKFEATEGGTLEGTLDYPNMGLGADLPTFPTATPDRDYMFIGWFDTAGNKVTQSDKVTRDTTTITAVFEKDEDSDGVPDKDQNVYIVSFEAGANGSLANDGLSSYKLIGGTKGDGIPLTHADVVGRYVVPTPVPNENCTFTVWTPYDPVSLSLTGDTTFTANFSADLNGDRIPDDQQNVYQVSFQAGSGGSLTGTTEFIAIGGLKGDGVALTNANVVGHYTVPTPVPGDNSTFDEWTPYDPAVLNLTKDATFTANFTEDLNGDGIPDGRQNVYHVRFEAESGGRLSGKTEFTAIGGVKGDGQALDLNDPGVVVGGFSEPQIIVDDEFEIREQWDPTDFADIKGDTTFRATFKKSLNADKFFQVTIITDEGRESLTVRDGETVDLSDYSGMSYWQDQTGTRYENGEVVTITMNMVFRAKYDDAPPPEDGDPPLPPPKPTRPPGRR